MDVEMGDNTGADVLALHASLPEIAEAVRNSKSRNLTQMHLCGLSDLNQTWWQPSSTITAVFNEGCLAHPALLQLSLIKCRLTAASGLQPISRAIEDSSIFNLKLLDLSWNYLSTGGVELLGKIIKAGHLSKLEYLSLSSCLLNALAMEAFAEALECGKLTKLSHLDLSKNSLSQKRGWAALGRVIQAGYLPSLQDLDLSKTGAVDDGIEALAQGMESGAIKDLTHLNLYGNEFGLTGVLAMVRVIMKGHLSKLTQIGFLPKTSNELQAVAKTFYEGHLPNLLYLNLGSEFTRRVTNSMNTIRVDSFVQAMERGLMLNLRILSIWILNQEAEAFAAALRDDVLPNLQLLEVFFWDDHGLRRAMDQAKLRSDYPKHLDTVSLIKIPDDGDFSASIPYDRRHLFDRRLPYQEIQPLSYIKITTDYYFHYNFDMRERWEQLTRHDSPTTSSSTPRDFIQRVALHSKWVMREGSVSKKQKKQPKKTSNSLETDAQEYLQALPERTVALGARISEMRALLKESHKIASVGMGGIGKTTLAKGLFNAIYKTFEYAYFVDVTELGFEATAHELGEHVSKLLHPSCSSSTAIRSAHQNEDEEDGLSDVLLVLDNVASEEQISAVPALDHPKSRLIVTSRNKKFRNGFTIYEVDVLNDDYSWRLFSGYAFRNRGSQFEEEGTTVETALQDVVKKVVKKCGGLPLTLEVVGSFLYNKRSLEVWEEVAQKLSRAEHFSGSDSILWQKLRVSYNALELVEKEMFLDLATIFCDEPLYVVKAAWRRFCRSAEGILETLMSRCLIREKENGKFTMHEQLRDLGQSIASPVKGRLDKCSRIWRPRDVANVLTSYTGAAMVEGLRMNRMKQPETELLKQQVPLSTLGRFPKLKFLILKNIPLMQDCETLPEKLSLLRWHGNEDMKSFPVRVEILRSLTVLDLAYWNCLETLPENFDELSELLVLNLEQMPIRELPAHFGHLKSLENLHLRLQNLRNLPETFDQLASLQRLTFFFCSNLERLPHSFGKLSSLQHLTFKACKELKRLPDSFGDLSSLVRLEFISCHSLESLPDSFGLLSSLEHLSFKYCSKLTNLPSSFKWVSSSLRNWKFQDFSEVEQGIHDTSRGARFRVGELVEEEGAEVDWFVWNERAGTFRQQGCLEDSESEPEVIMEEDSDDDL